MALPDRVNGASATERVLHWPRVLVDHVNRNRARSWSWGEHDCTTFVCDGTRLIAADGLDLVDWARGRYASPRAALDVLRDRVGEIGDRDALEVMVEQEMRRWGRREIAVSQAARGDVLMFEALDGELMAVAIALSLGEMCAHAVSSGVGFRPTRDALRAWRV